MSEASVFAPLGCVELGVGVGVGVVAAVVCGGSDTVILGGGVLADPWPTTLSWPVERAWITSDTISTSVTTIATLNAAVPAVLLGQPGFESCLRCRSLMS
jgi:hypothetical protein